MNSVVISGFGHLSALGQGRLALENGLSGKLKPHISVQIVATKDRDVELLAYKIEELHLPAELPESIQRRMPRLSKMCFAASVEAIETSIKRAGVLAAPERVGIVVGTTFGPLEQASVFEKRLFTGGPAGASPTLFASSIPNAIASHLSICFGVQGPISTVTCMEQTAIGSLRLAYDWIMQDVVDHVLVTIGDELSEFHVYAMAHTDDAASKELIPHSDFCTAIAGEGVVSFVLSRGDLAGPRLAEIRDIQLAASDPPMADRYFAAAYGRENEWSKYLRWVHQTPECHADLFGSMVIGAAFEVACALMENRSLRDSLTCVQLSRQNAQTITLSL